MFLPFLIPHDFPPSLQPIAHNQLQPQIAIPFVPKIVNPHCSFCKRTLESSKELHNVVAANWYQNSGCLRGIKFRVPQHVKHKLTKQQRKMPLLVKADNQDL